MSRKRSIIRSLDRAPTRSVLAWLATARAKLHLRQNVKVWYEGGIWLHRAGPYSVPDGPRFDYYDATLLTWKDEIPGYFRNANDFWFSHYRPKAGDVIVDVGAGRGEDSLPFSQAVGPTGRVLAIEADPTSYRLLERFCALNKLNNIKPIQVAIMDREGTVTIADSPEPWEQTTVTWSGGTDRGSVRATALDQLCRDEDIDSIDFLKMNIEGAEVAALQGMRETMPKVARICVCCHDFRADRGDGEQYRTRAFVEHFLTAAGFVLSSRPDSPHDFVRDHIYGERVSASNGK
jgi:FkbM family methyltransferase